MNSDCKQLNSLSVLHNVWHEIDFCHVCRTASGSHTKLAQGMSAAWVALYSSGNLIFVWLLLKQ